ncbi:hypothetical protein F9K33_07345 [bacterium]|nr:MAG: hypothetical protein F9K33_07345 [bacterium]
MNNTDQPEIIEKGNEPIISSDGVDLTLIRWMLSLSPQKRVETLQSQLKNIFLLRKKRHEP